MEHATRQFMVLTKKLRKELRQALEVFYRDFERYTETERTADENYQQQEQVRQEWLNNLYLQRKFMPQTIPGIDSGSDG